MHPDVKKLRSKMTKTGEKRVAYSPKEVLTKIREMGSPLILLSQLKQWEDARVIPPSIFVFEAHFYTLRQINLLADWLNGKLPRNVDIQTYFYQHWYEPDEEETEER
jgi:hypothetical protein